MKAVSPVVENGRAGDRILKFSGSIFIKDGRILSVGSSCEAKERFDGNGMLLLPGFVDPHTHIPFSGERSAEFVMRASGKGYAEILKAGGGIHSTVKKVREASAEKMLIENERYAFWLLKNGVTSFECKSGYGLDLETEMKQLEIVKELSERIPQTVVPTFLGAHAIPEIGEKAYIDELINMLETVKEKKLSEYVDVFCDDGAFSVEGSVRLLKIAKAMGFKLRAHSEELSANGFSAVASELGAVSVDHLLKVTDSEIPVLAKNGTIATLMPSTSFYLKDGYAPARKLMDGGVTVALGSDFNPGSNTFHSPFFTMHLAVNRLGMTPEEAFIAHTFNAAKVIGLEREIGTLEEGKRADFVLIDAPDIEYLPYMPFEETIRAVFKDGRRIFENRDRLPGEG